MKQLLQDFLDFYRNQLLIGFFKKRGKSVIIPHVVFCIERLIDQYADKDVIKVLDLGCGEGHLLRVLNQAGQISGFSKKLEFYGFDYDEDMLSSAAAQNNIVAKFIKIDLRHDTLEEYYGDFDIVVAVNTLHEVYSSYIGEDNDNYPADKLKYGKQKISALIGEVAKMLSPDGSFILYDGLAPEKELLKKSISFEIVNPILEHYFAKMMNDFSMWPIQYKVQGKVVTMRYHDFCWFITTFKYLNTKLWPFESRQVYQYMSKEEFTRAFEKAGLIPESVGYLTNDIGLWRSAVKPLKGGLDFPMKSILIVASKHYIPSKHDYFAAN